MDKICSKCKITKDITEFYKRSDKPHLFQSHCKKCICDSRKLYRLNNIEKFKQKDLMYHSKNRIKKNIYLKKWQNKNRDNRKLKYNIKRKTDINFLLRSRLHNRIRTALKRNSKKSSSEILLGCSINEFKIYFQSKFTKNMSWDHFLNGEIHIDHIKPCCKFDLSKKDEQLECFNYKNLQPLWVQDNLAKGSKEVCYR